MSDDDGIDNESVGTAGAQNGAGPEYKVGYCKPPLDTRFKPGVSGNPKGRPAGRPNFKAMVERVAYLKVPVRQGEETRWMSLLEAVVFGLGLKGAKGDHRSGSTFIKTIKDVQEIQPENFFGHPANARPSAGLFVNLDEDLLSADDMTDLSRLADVVDLGGDITALKIGDFTRLQQIVNKGRGKDITARP
jgi:hypothetical protein